MLATVNALLAFSVQVPSAPFALRRHVRAAPSMFENDEERVLYAVGLSVARSLGELETLLTKDELRVVGRAINDKLLQEEPPDFDWTKYGPQVEPLLQSRQGEAAAKMAVKGEAALQEAAAEEGAFVTDSGLVYRQLVEGDGATPTAGTKVTAHYTGKLTDGTVFDSSVERGEPLTFPLEAVIKGWQEGLKLMKVGGKAMLTIPSDLGYGAQGTGPIPPAAVLNFEVELLGVE